MAFDSDIVAGVIENIDVLKERFQKLMDQDVPLISSWRPPLDDKSVRPSSSALTTRTSAKVREALPRG